MNVHPTATKLTHFSIKSAAHTAGSNWLVPDLSGDDYDAAQEALEKPGVQGRLRRAPLLVKCEVGENSVPPSPLPYSAFYAGLVVADEAFLARRPRKSKRASQPAP